LEVTTFCCCIFDWYHSADQIIKEQKERLNYQDEKLDRQEQKLDQQAQLLQQQAKLIEALTKTSISHTDQIFQTTTFKRILLLCHVSVLHDV